jgi:hypothetical protein
MKKVLSSVLTLSILLLTSCDKDSPEMTGCSFTFRGKSYEGTVVQCFPSSGWDNTLHSYPSPTSSDWVLRISDGKNTGNSYVMLSDPTIDYDYNLTSEKAQITISGNTYYFTASGMHTILGGMYYPGQLKGSCTCTEIFP